MSNPQRALTELRRAVCCAFFAALWILAPGCSRPPTQSTSDEPEQTAATATTSAEAEASSPMESAPEDATVTADPRERVEVAEVDRAPETRAREEETSRTVAQAGRRSDAPQVAQVGPIAVEADERRREPEPVSRPPEPAAPTIDTAEIERDSSATPEPEVVETFETRTMILDSGAEFAVEFASAVSSEWSQVGDEVEVRLAESHMVDGVLTVPAGSLLLGEVTEARATRRFGGSAALSIRFDTLLLASGDEVEVDLAWSALDQGQKKKDAARIGGGAAAGAVAGSVLKDSDGAKVGALIGAAIGAARAGRDRGEPVEIPEGSLRTLVLDQELEVPVRVRRLELR